MEVILVLFFLPVKLFDGSTVGSLRLLPSAGAGCVPHGHVIFLLPLSLFPSNWEQLVKFTRVSSVVVDVSAVRGLRTWITVVGRESLWKFFLSRVYYSTGTCLQRVFVCLLCVCLVELACIVSISLYEYIIVKQSHTHF